MSMSWLTNLARSGGLTPPPPIGPPPCRHHHNGPSLGGVIAGAIVNAAIAGAVTSAASTVYNKTASSVRTAMNGGPSTLYTGPSAHGAGHTPANYPSACPHCGAGTSGSMACDYCGGRIC